MNEPYNPYGELLQEAINIVYIIYSMGGMANKSTVEDVLMLRHPSVDRAKAHDIMNHIEYYNLTGHKALRIMALNPPSLFDFPEISQVNIPHISQRIRK
jgi:hypothetical protein